MTISITAHADKKVAGIRLFALTNTLNPKPESLNTDSATVGIEPLKSIGGFAFEVDAQLLSWVKGGVRGGGTWNKMTNPATPEANFVAVQQSIVGGILRFSLFQSKILHFELFTEGGITSSKVDIKKGATEGNFNNNGVYARGGLTAAIGWDPYFLFIEGGPEWNRLENLKSEGTTSASIDAIDLGGTYAAVGIIIGGGPLLRQK